MALTLLPRLRSELEFLPSPLTDRPGLLVRDPFRYTDAAIIVPPLLVRCLGCFDGAHTDSDLHAWLVRSTGQLDVDEAATAFSRALSQGGFLDDEAFRVLRDRRRRDFAQAPTRAAAHAGGGYPEDQPALTQTLNAWLGEPPVPASPSPAGGVPIPRDLVAIAAPHVSPIGAPATYRAAYRALAPAFRDRTFVILGTSHYGQPGKLGLTRKPFQTPLGEAATDVALVTELGRAAAGGAEMEDYCHSIEHSIEFQVLFLQAVFGPTVRILPILCGAFSETRPEEDDGVARALDALGELQARHGDRLLWVLGVDLAHVGRRYGDRLEARAHEGALADVAARDRARLDRVAAADADGFWELLHERGSDDLKWCGAAPIYAFLRAVPGARGQTLHYDHWNIDDASVVSFAAMAFDRR